MAPPSPLSASEPHPCKLPAGIPRTSALVTKRHPCPDCGVSARYAHCAATACVMLYCPSCDLIWRPDTGAKHKREAKAS